MTSAELFDTLMQALIVLAVTIHGLTGAILLLARRTHRAHHQERSQLNAETERLLLVYLTEGKWDVQPTPVSQQAQRALRARLVMD